MPRGTLDHHQCPGGVSTSVRGCGVLPSPRTVFLVGGVSVIVRICLREPGREGEGERVREGGRERGYMNTSRPAYLSIS